MDLTSTERDHYVAATMRPDGLVADSRVLELLETIGGLRAEIAHANKFCEDAQACSNAAEDRAAALTAERDAWKGALYSLSSAADFRNCYSVGAGTINRTINEVVAALSPAPAPAPGAAMSTDTAALVAELRAWADNWHEHGTGRIVTRAADFIERLSAPHPTERVPEVEIDDDGTVVLSWPGALEISILPSGKVVGTHSPATRGIAPWTAYDPPATIEQSSKVGSDIRWLLAEFVRFAGDAPRLDFDEDRTLSWIAVMTDRATRALAGEPDAAFPVQTGETI